MNHPEHDKLVAIAEGRQMQLIAPNGKDWVNRPADLALQEIARGNGKYWRIAPEQPAPTAGLVANPDYCRYGVCKPEEPHAPGCTELAPSELAAANPAPAPTKTVTVPLTSLQKADMVMEYLGPAALVGGKMSVLQAFETGIAAAERAHGITDAATAGREGG